MKTLQEEWQEYRDKIYPDGISGTQNRECHQAFFSGAFVFATALNEIAALPDGEAEKRLAKLVSEATEVVGSIAQSLKSRN